MLSNIDPVYFLTFIVPIALNLALVLYCRKKGTLNLAVLGYSFLAYFIAIGIKMAFQYLTAGFVTSRFGYTSIETAMYYGLQTSFLEVGLAYMFASYAFKKKHISAANSVSYGISLSFWENAIYLGVLTGISLVADFVLISIGPSSISHLVYTTISKNDPALLYGPVLALISTAVSILERTSSLLAHTAWGILTVISVATKKKVYFFIALPMGLIDALVPYASVIGIYNFELIVFVLSVIFIAIAAYVLRKTKGTVSPADISGPKIGGV